MTTYSTFDASDYLDDDEIIAEYLTAAIEDPNPAVLSAALLHVAKARGVTKVAEAAGLSRTSLYKALSAEAKPRYETIRTVLQAMNVHIAIVPNQPVEQKVELEEMRPSQAI